MESAKPYFIRCTGCRAKNRIPADKINRKPTCGKCRQPLDLSGVFAGRPVEVSDGSFEKQVLGSPIPVLAVFYSPSCPVCQSEMPVIKRVASGLNGRIRVANINIDQNPRTASR
ncbi:MAG: thioredoxin family protein, partial [Desulfosalsimonas sp.]